MLRLGLGTVAVAHPFATATSATYGARMNRTLDLLMSLHFLGIVLLGGGLLGGARLLVLATAAAVPVGLELAQAARRLLILGDIGLTLALVGGIGAILHRPDRVLAQPYMHVKLTLVATLVGLHVFTRIRAKRAAAGQAAYPAALFVAALLLFAAIIAVVVFKVPFKSPQS